jgi:hypothetical protein
VIINLLKIKIMKKFFLLLVTAAMLSTASFAQPVSDNVVIPIGVTINSIMRLNVAQGGNIEFVFNTFDDFQAGLNSTYSLTQYQTKIDMTATTNFKVFMVAETDLVPITGSVGADMAINVISYQLDVSGVNIAPVSLSGNLSLSSIEIANCTLPTVITDGTIIINWACGVTNSVVGYKADRYSTNVVIRAEVQ